MSHNSKGESHRIYWQQWISSSTGGNGNETTDSRRKSPERRSRRELITSSAAVRISYTGAKALDVTNLLRATLSLGEKAQLSSQSPQPDERDSLVLVGTLYSLPRDAVQFEHELDVDQAIVRSDPYHIVKTLHPDDDPLEVRKRMEDHLQSLQQSSPTSARTIISPKLQWYFLPAANETGSLIPNCVELDGYCTSLEEELDDEHIDDEDDDEECGHASDLSRDEDEMYLKFPWLNKSDSTLKLPEDIDQMSSMTMRFSHEDRLFQQLRACQSALRNYCLTGYLLKRSRKDPHVWRNVHCVLTDEHLWSVSRIYTDKATACRYAKHGRIRLTRALLLEPSADYVPLYRTPFAFEVVSGKGTSHLFRAANKQLQAHWIHALAERIAQSFENSLIDQAELIVADECLVRGRRMAQQAVVPLWKVLAEKRGGSSSHKNTGQLASEPHVGAVLRYGMHVASFKECCRYINSSLPAKNPVVVRSPLRKENFAGMSNSEIHPDPIAPALQAVIQSSWSRATDLLAEATRVTLSIRPKMPRSIETQCQHIDCIMNGRFRANSHDGSELTSSSTGDSITPPPTRDPLPADLFDGLLSELQLLVARSIS
jgi:hypothetical protein